MEQLVTQYHWMQLSNEQRLLMRQEFNIPKSGGVVMQNNTMITDGSNENDLKTISIDSMKKFLLIETESSVSFKDLYEMTITRIDQIIYEKEVLKQKELENQKVLSRLQSTNDIVNSLLETISNLPLDSQIKIKTVLSHIGEQNTNVKETSSTEEDEESINKQGTKSTGSRGRPSKRLS